MSILSKLRLGGGSAPADDIQLASTVEESNAGTQTAAADNNQAEAGVADEKIGREEDIVPDPETQRGVNRIQAVTLAWTKPSLAAALILYISFLTC